MIITVIHGQVHKGSTYNTTKLVLDNINNVQKINEFFMGKDGPSFCNGCFNCILKDPTKCVEYDKTKPILEAILECDLVIIDSPTYCMEMTGQLKTLFDHFGYLWLAHRPNLKMFTKRAVVISTAAGAGSKNVCKSIKRQLFWLGISNTYIINQSVMASSFNDVSDKIKLKLKKKALNVSKKVSYKRKVKPTFKFKFIYNFMRLLHKSESMSTKIDRDYWNENNMIKNKKPWKK